MPLGPEATRDQSRVVVVHLGTARQQPPCPKVHLCALIKHANNVTVIIMGDCLDFLKIHVSGWQSRHSVLLPGLLTECGCANGDLTHKYSFMRAGGKKLSCQILPFLGQITRLVSFFELKIVFCAAMSCDSPRCRPAAFCLR